MNALLATHSCRSTPSRRKHRWSQALQLGLIGLLVSPAWALDATVGTGTPGSCTEAALNAAIQTVQSDIQGGTVSFNCGAVIGGGGRTISLSSQKLLTGVITIDGGGLISLDGQNATRVFQINPRPNPEDATVVTLRNLELLNGFAAGGFGGAIEGNAGIQLNLHNVIVRNSRAGLTGGALAMAPGSVLNVQDSSFRENTASDGGAMAISAVTTIDNSRFVLNTATGNGSTGQGGAIQSWVADLNIRNSRFAFNLGQLGGAIYKRDAGLQVLGTEFSDNSAGLDGGAVHAMQNLNTLLIKASRFHGNLASNGQGGGVIASNPEVARCLFDNNRAQIGGALAVRVNGSAITPAALIYDSTLSNNVAQQRGGALSITSPNAGVALLGQITTYNNSANTGAGGDLHADFTEVQIETSSLLEGRAALAAGGGSIAVVNAGNVKLYASIVLSRQAQDCIGPMQSMGANIGAASCNLTAPGNGQIQADQVVLTFAELGLAEFANYGGPYHNYLPQAGSRVLNTFLFRCPTVGDARGMARPVGARCDSGAVERQAVELPAGLFRSGFEGDWE